MTEESKNPQLDDVQRQLLDRLAKNDTSGFKQLLVGVKNVNFVDDSGMSCLAHASFKGNREAVQVLLDMVGIPGTWTLLVINMYSWSHRWFYLGLNFLTNCVLSRSM